MNEPQSAKSLFFDSDEHPENTLKAFNKLVEQFELRYNAQFPDPPKVSMDSALDRWKYTNGTEPNPNPRPTLDQYDEIKEEWKGKDRLAKFLGMVLSNRLYSDWQVTAPNEKARKSATLLEFVPAMRTYYSPTENPTLKNFKFRELVQGSNETFPAFCNRVEKEARHCFLKCHHQDCNGEDTATRDQIVIGTINHTIREEALLKSWNLSTLRAEGMKIESATKGGAEISGENILKIGKYSYKNIKNPTQSTQKRENISRKFDCYFCGKTVTNLRQHKDKCIGRKSDCSKCNKHGHVSEVCRSTSSVRKIEQDTVTNTNEDEEHAYNVNIFHVKTDTSTSESVMLSGINKKYNFTVQVIVNNNLDTVIADTGEKVSVCGTTQAKRWNLLQRMTPTQTKIKPYNSPGIKVKRIARCAITFGHSSVPVEWYIISGSCEPILSGEKSLQLGIIQFNGQADRYQPINMINTNVESEFKNSL